MAEKGAKRRSKPATPKGATVKPKAKPRKAATKAGQHKTPEATRKRATKRKAAVAEVRAPSELVAEAQAKGAARTVENAKLYQEVFRRYVDGWTHGDNAAKSRLSERRIEQIVDDLKGAQLHAIGLGDPLFGLRMAQELVLRHSRMIGQYARLADETPKSQGSIKLGYLKRRDEALRAYTELMQELGYLPKNLGTVRVASDLIGMADAMLDVMEQHEVPEKTQRAVIEAMELRVRHTRGKLALDLGGAIDGTAEEVTDGAQQGAQQAAAAAA